MLLVWNKMCYKKVRYVLLCNFVLVHVEKKVISSLERKKKIQIFTYLCNLARYR